MTKQEEVRDGVITNIAKACPDMLNADIVKLADKILKDEGSQGLVIKVERELPHSLYVNLMFGAKKKSVICENMELNTIYEEGQRDMLKAGYVAVEPLIEKQEGKVNE